MIPQVSEHEVPLELFEQLTRSTEETASRYGEWEVCWEPDRASYFVTIFDRQSGSILARQENSSVLLGFRDAIESAHQKTRPNEPLYAD